MTTATDTRESLSAALKTSTAEAHDKAEHSVFMDDLLAGKLSVADFIALQEQSWLFYSALEDAARAVADHPLASGIVDPALERVNALEHDLNHLHGTAEYIARLNDIEATKDVARLLAHHYVRYLGDLSGGQVIGRMMQRHYGVSDECVTFYRFAEIPKTKPYKDNYRAALDALPIDAADRESLLAEAADAFLLNLNLFNALGAR